jgi:hypothetical protein
VQLLTDNLKSRLPLLLSQEAVDEPVVYAKYFLPGTPWAWYVLEGEEKDGEFLFFGFVAGLHDEFGHFRLSELEAIRGPDGQIVQRDDAFIEGKLTDVVPAPDR